MINRLAVGFWKACLCQFAWWGRIFKVGLAFIACWRGAEGGRQPGLELSVPWYIRIAKRGSGGELRLAKLQNLHFWCCCLWAAAVATASVTRILYPTHHKGLSAGTGCFVTGQEVSGTSPLLSASQVFSTLWCGSKDRVLSPVCFPSLPGCDWRTMGLLGLTLALALRFPGPFFARSLLLIKRKQRGSCSTLWLLQAHLPLQTLPFYSTEDMTPRSYSLWPETSIKKANDVFEVVFWHEFVACCLNRINHSECGQV